MIPEIKDIILPAKISMAPVAYGYWLIGLVVLVLLTFIALGVYFIRRDRKWRKKFILELHAIDHSSAHYALEINEVLKKIALDNLPRSFVNSMDDNKWKQWLHSCAPDLDLDILDQYLELRYQNVKLTNIQIEKLRYVAAKWIMQAKFKEKRGKTK